jgi:hypothetical protein
MGADLRLHLKAVKDIREANSHLRKEFARLVAPPAVTLFSRCASLFSYLFVAKRGGAEILKHSCQQEIGENITKLKELINEKVQPTIEDIRREHHGKTFRRTKDTPEPLILAAIPTEKIGKVPSHVKLMIDIENHIASAEDSPARVVKSTLGQRMVITRFNKNNEEEILEISYRREGKVDVTVTNKNGVTEKSLWNDDAERLAKAFVDGKTFRFEATRYKDYTVADPTHV